MTTGLWSSDWADPVHFFSGPTCTFLILCPARPSLGLWRRCPLRGTSRGSELQRRWRRTEAGSGDSRSWPGKLQQHFGSLLGKLEQNSKYNIFTFRFNCNMIQKETFYCCIYTVSYSVGIYKVIDIKSVGNDSPLMLLVSILWPEMTEVKDNTDVRQSQIIFMTAASGDGRQVLPVNVSEPNDRVK